MATPASRFVAVPEEDRDALPLWVPPQLNEVPCSEAPEREEQAQVEAGPEVPAAVVDALAEALNYEAVEIQRLVPASGNLRVLGQQFWLGPMRAGQVLSMWIDTKSVHLSFDGRRLKSLPSRLSANDLARLRADGARRAGPPPAPPSGALSAGIAVELERTVNACGLLAVGGVTFYVGIVLVGDRVTLRVEGDVVQVISGGVLVRTVTAPLSSVDRLKLRGGRVAGPPPVLREGPIVVQRIVSHRGTVQVAGQRIQVGFSHARKIVTIEVHDTEMRAIDTDGELLAVVPRTSQEEVTHVKAFGRRA
jgi:hypothetical protein